MHGWVVDPQDEATATAVGTCTYNELVEILIRTMDDESIKRLQSQTSTQTSSLSQGSLAIRAPSERQQTVVESDETSNLATEDPSLDKSMFKLRLESNQECNNVRVGSSLPREDDLGGGDGAKTARSPDAAMQKQNQPNLTADQRQQADLIRQFLEGNCSQLTW